MVRRAGLVPKLSTAAKVRTLGVEEEFLLVDRETLRAVPAAEETLAAAVRSPVRAGHGTTAFHSEMKLEQMEVVSPPVRTRSELMAVIAEGRRAADRAAQAAGARVVPLATSPDACGSHLASSTRYEEMTDRFALTARQQLTCGMHIHVAVHSPEEGVGVLDRLRPWLPVILALSANSPFWQGEDTGFASFRYQAWGRWPTSGPTPVFGAVENYRRAVEASVGAGISLDAEMIYFDARLSTHVPTVEVRIADVCLRGDDAVTVALLVRALVDRAAAEWRAGIPPQGCTDAAVRLASWRASRWGVDGDLLHPSTQIVVPSKIAVEELLRHVDDHFITPVERSQVREGVGAIVDRGNGSIQQRRAVEVTGTTTGAVAEALRQGIDALPGFADSRT
jgi:carboxylate-amine ligase